MQEQYEIILRHRGYPACDTPMGPVAGKASVDGQPATLTLDFTLAEWTAEVRGRDGALVAKAGRKARMVGEWNFEDAEADPEFKRRWVWLIFAHHAGCPFDYAN